MIFTSEEKKLIYNNKVFIKKIKDKEHYIKPFYEYNGIIPLINIKSAYESYLLKYFKSHIPDFKFIKMQPPEYLLLNSAGKKIKNITLFIQEKIKGTKINNLKEFKSLIDLDVNAKLKKGMKKMLEKEKASLLLFPSKEYNYKDNFILSEKNKLIYIDSRNPIVFENKNNKKNFEFLKKLIY